MTVIVGNLLLDHHLALWLSFTSFHYRREEGFILLGVSQVFEPQY